MGQCSTTVVQSRFLRFLDFRSSALGGYVMLQHNIPCSGAMQMHNWCAIDLPNVCLHSQ
jgi:hypothetical protein